MARKRGVGTGGGEGLNRVWVIRANDFENAIKLLGLKRCRETFLLRNYQLPNMRLMSYLLGIGSAREH